MGSGNGTRRKLLLAATIVVGCQMTLPGSVPPGNSIRGFSETQLQEQRSWEEKMMAIPQPELLREYMSVLAAEPHATGSARDRANAEWILNKLRSWGLEAAIEEYRVLFPSPRERLVELLAPEKYTARLKEPPVNEDKDSGNANQIDTYNAYSADGDVTAQLVYVNYGLPSDYETLGKLGVDVKGKIVLARYGASWRGIKPKLAHEHGAIGCLIYSDPKDDGFYQGPVYPEGPFRPEQGVQRGSVADMPIFPGDPLTPGMGATAETRRLTLKEAPTITKIPVLPISYGDALPLLRNLRGPLAPESWRGALPVTYFVGPGPASVRLKVSSNWDTHTLYDVIARIPGSTYPDEWIIQGNHHDAWVNGASDPVSALIALLEEARAYGELLKQGWRPKRTIIIAAWDGEEPGLLGSTEWAEQHAAELDQKAVIYINGDSNGRARLNVGGSHTLERFIHEVERDVPDPLSDKSVYDIVRNYRIEKAGSEQEEKELRGRADQPIAALGSGSDYTVFIDHLGIASLNIGFEGDPGGVYHSIYDSIYWFTHFSDSTFVYGRALAQLDGIAAMRLADAAVLPFEFTNLADTVAHYVREIEKLTEERGGKLDLRPLENGRQALLKSARAFERIYAKEAEAGFKKSPAQLHELNKLLYRSERVLMSPGGLPRRPWFKHQLYAPGLYTGYGVKTVPFVREAVEQSNWDEAALGVKVVNERLTALAAQIDSAAKLLKQ